MPPKPKPRVALLTSPSGALLTELVAQARDEPELEAALRDAGLEPFWLPWGEGDDGDPARVLRVAREASALLIRSTWCYADSSRRKDEFIAWLRAATTGGAGDGAAEARPTLLNPLRVVEWNSCKAYLVELAAAGVPTVPTLLIGRGRGAEAGGQRCSGGVPATAPATGQDLVPVALGRLRELAGAWATAELVVKPVVGASARGWDSVSVCGTTLCATVFKISNEKSQRPAAGHTHKIIFLVLYLTRRACPPKC